MAETAPLTTAHSHVRKASQLFQEANNALAAEEYQKAATDFARAAKGTNDSEALRVLKLLEDQHRKLAQLIQNPSSIETDLADEDHVAAKHASLPTNAPAVAATSDRVAPATATESTSHLAKNRITKAPRDSSPSLAREIASRRGIPQPGRSTLSPAAQARARPSSPASSRVAPARVVPQIPPSIMDSQSDLRGTSKASKADDDEGFTRFYNNLATGTMSKLSSVLAYAGLPLTADDTATDTISTPKSTKRTVSANHEPDVKKYISKAALDAIEDEHRQRGTLGHGFGPAESFYVVQKGGGTISYADIARNQQQHLAGLGLEDEDAEFVDAKEVQGQASPKQSRFSQNQRTSFGSARTNEELDLENATLKQTLQDLAVRLSAFETHAQDASFAALTHSVATLRPSAAPDPAVEERIRQLERQVETQAEERQKLEGLAAKQEKTLKKYHAKFEEIKKSAREKEKARRDKEKSAKDDSMNVPVVEAA